MTRLQLSPAEIVARLQRVETLKAQGRGVAEAIRTAGLTSTSYYRWRSEFDGLRRTLAPSSCRDPRKGSPK
jgi:hypothetical protein